MQRTKRAKKENGRDTRPAGGAVWRMTVLSLVLVWSMAAGDSVRQADAEDRPVSGTDEQTHPLVPVLQLAHSSRDALRDVEDFEATFSKNERVGRRMIPHTMHMKFRSQPFSVYLRFQGPQAGREVLYVEGQNDDKLLARETGLRGLIGTVALAPTAPEAMSEGRHPITRIGLENLIQGVINQWEKIVELWKDDSRDDGVEVTYYDQVKLGEMECTVIESTHPRLYDDLKFHVTRLYLDKKTNLPVRVEQYGFPPRQDAAPPLIEEYTYTNLRTNVGLEDRDFDRRNPDYGF